MSICGMMTRLTVPALALAALSIQPARAAYLVTFLQSGPDVVATGSGSIDTSDLVDFVGGNVGAEIINWRYLEFVGDGGSVGDWSGITGPAAFNNVSSGRADFIADLASGDGVGITSNFGADPSQFLFLPDNYTSGAALSDTATWSNSTLAGLDLLPGTYVWSWGSGADADTFTVQIGPAVTVGIPEPAMLGLFAAAFGALGILRRRGT